MYSPEGQGDEFAMMTITYTRRLTSAAPNPAD